MGIVTAIFLFLAYPVGKVLSKLLEEEAKAWLPHIVERVVCGAVEQLPEVEQERFSEEWRAHLDEVPGALGKLMTALGFWYAARKMQTEALGSLRIGVRLVAVPLLVPLLWNLYTTFRGLADFFDLPTHPSINPGQFAFAVVVTLIVLAFIIASRPIWNVKSENAPVLLLKAASVICISINVGASWVGMSQVIIFEKNDPGVAVGFALVTAIVVLSTIGMSTLLFDKHDGNKPSLS